MDPTTIDIGSIDNVWQAIVVIALIAAVLVVPQGMAWMQAKRSAVAVNEVKKTLTTNNGGSHVKDSLDRIEKHLETLDTRVGSLERAAEKRQRFRWR